MRFEMTCNVQHGSFLPVELKITTTTTTTQVLSMATACIEFEGRWNSETTVSLILYYYNSAGCTAYIFERYS